MPTGQRKFAREDGKYADFLDTNSGNLKPDGTAFIGSSSLAAPSDHIHPAAAASPSILGFPGPASGGYVAWTGDYATCPCTLATGASWPAGVMILARLDCPPGVPVNGYISVFWLTNASLANTFLGLYTTAGSLIGTSADQSANATGLQRIAVSGFTATPANGLLYAAYLNGTSGVAGGPSFISGGWYTHTPLTTNMPPEASPPYRAAQYGSGQSSLPSTVTVASWAYIQPYIPWLAID